MITQVEIIRQNIDKYLIDYLEKIKPKNNEKSHSVIPTQTLLYKQSRDIYNKHIQLFYNKSESIEKRI